MRIIFPNKVLLIAIVILVLCMPITIGCSSGDDETTDQDGTIPGCFSEPEVMTTNDGIEFVRTPDACFENLPDFPYEAKYVEIDGLRQSYVDEGPVDADPILLLHGQPSWSYLYRKMIPVLVDGGHRVIAMDHLGMGRSDKPIDVEYYSYLGHVDRLEKFIKDLNLEHITLFCQDWGSVIGLHVAGEHPEWFDRLVVGDGTLPVIPAGIQPFPSVENPNELNVDIVLPFTDIPPQQPPFFDEEGNRLIPGDPSAGFGNWIVYSMTAASFHPAEIVEAMTYFDITPEEEAAYDAPFPSRIYMAGPRVFPSLVNDLPGITQDAWAGLTEYDKPFLTIWASNDPGNLGQQATQDNLINNIPGAEGQPHVRLPEASHFLQDDQGAEIARRMVEFMEATKNDLNAATAKEASEASGSSFTLKMLQRTGENLFANLAYECDACSFEQFAAITPPPGWSKSPAQMILPIGELKSTLSFEGVPSSMDFAPEIPGNEFDLIAKTLDGKLVENSENVLMLVANVMRETRLRFPAGNRVHELTDPEGNIFVLFAYEVDSADFNRAHFEDADALANYPHPDGWAYSTRIVDEELVLDSEGVVTVLSIGGGTSSVWEKR